MRAGYSSVKSFEEKSCTQNYNQKDRTIISERNPNLVGQNHILCLSPSHLQTNLQADQKPVTFLEHFTDMSSANIVCAVNVF